jgi:Domain of unknown function (DUF4232)
MRTKLAIGLVGAAAALGCIASGPAAASTAEASGSAAPCTTAGLLIWIPHGLGSGTAGSIYYGLDFVNLSGRACSLSGFPAVSSLGLDGRKIGKPAARIPDQKARTIKLVPGATAAAQLRVVDTGAITPSVCRPTTAAALRVSLAGKSGSRVVPLGFEACAGGGGILSVGAFHAVE